MSQAINNTQIATYQVALTTPIQGVGRVLNGEVRQIEALVSAKTKANLEVSKKIIEYVNDIVFDSLNYPSRLGRRFPSGEEYLKIRNVQLPRFRYMRDTSDPAESIRRISECHIGNCDEMTLIGLQCPEIGSTPVSLYSIIRGEHLILGVGVEFNELEPWKDAVICDPWANAYYPVSQYRHFLYTWTGVVNEIPGISEEGSFFGPCVNLFNPRIHALQLIESNTRSLDQLTG